MENKHVSDENLVIQAKQGDSDALDTLLNRYKPLAKSKARDYFLTGGDPDDLMQEGMIGLYKAVLDFDANKGAQFSSFANLCITRQILSAIKAASRKKHLPLNTSLSLHKETAETTLETIPDTKIQNPETLFLSQEAYKSIGEFLQENLSPLERDVLALYMQGLSYAEIGNKIEKPPKAVENALGRIRRKILPLRN